MPIRLPGMPMRLVNRLRTLLRVRLFTKILVANSVLVMLAALAGVLAGAQLASGGEHRAFAVAVPVILAGIALTILVDAIILRLALHPLHQLERAAERVREGELAVRARTGTWHGWRRRSTTPSDRSSSTVASSARRRRARRTMRRSSGSASPMNWRRRSPSG